MSYIPPHKRHPKTGSSSNLSPSLPPGTKVPDLLQLKKDKMKKNTKATSLVYAQDCIQKWFVVGLPDNDDSKLSRFARLEPMATDNLSGISLALVLKESCEETRVSANPWEFIAETVKEDFVVSLQKVRDVIKDNNEAGGLKPYLVVRFGKVSFQSHSSKFDLEFTKGSLERRRRSFYVNLPPSYMISISNDLVPKMGLDFLVEKDSYRVMLSDNTQPGCTISCKCEVMQDNSLQLRKIEVIPVRHFIADMTCLDKNLDLRLMLLTKRKSCFVTDEDLENIKSLIGSAILDQEYKGGLKWPLGKSYLGRHDVFAVWHTNSRMFKYSSMKLKVRVADRYNFRTSEGEVAREVNLKLNNVLSHLGEEKFDTEVTFEMLKENLELIWKHLLL